MAENNNQTENQIKKERFEFVFTVNGNIICQRYFRINGFKKKSLCSEELVEAFDRCVTLIKNDLSNKSRVFLWYTAPRVYNNKEEMDNSYYGDLPVPSYIILRDSDDMFVWDGEKAKPYNGYFNKSDYIEGISDDAPCTLKLAFLDSGKEVISEVWDGNVYPRFVRTNIDLSNSKNKYEYGENYAPFEATLINAMIAGQRDLIPQIVKELCVCCSRDNNYTTKVTYGDKEYNLNLDEEWNNYVSQLGSKLKKKTEKYLKTLY